VFQTRLELRAPSGGKCAENAESVKSSNTRTSGKTRRPIQSSTEPQNQRFGKALERANKNVLVAAGQTGTIAENRGSRATVSVRPPAATTTTKNNNNNNNNNNK